LPLTAKARLSELMKRLSYPLLEINFKTNWKHANLLPGDVIIINNDRVGMSNFKARISSVNFEETTNDIHVICQQLIEGLFDSYFLPPGLSVNAPQDNSVEPFVNERIFELPYNKQTGFEPAFIILVARTLGIEQGFRVLKSLESGGPYEDLGVKTSFSETGFLDEEYPDSTLPVDTEQGILFTPLEDETNFLNLSQLEWLTTSRFAIIGEEMIAFQSINPEGVSSFRLSGCIRGVLGTPIQTHSFGAQIWLAEIADNLLEGISDINNFYIKNIPFLTYNTIDPSLATENSVLITSKAKKPRNPGHLIATRVGSTITLEIFPNSPDIDGAGQGNPDEITDTAPHPFPFSGDGFEISYGGGPTMIVTGKHF
jgi:hypothetical protein